MPEQLLIEASRNSLPPLSSRVMFWRPRFMADSPWLEHIPFYFWLIEAQQPELVFDADVVSGSTYFALCQAVDKLNTETLCMASFHSQCQQQEKIAQYNEDHYQEFSILSPEGALDSIEDIDDGTLDLLILKDNSPLIHDKKKNGKQGNSWERKLSDSAIVLVHGSQKKAIKPLCRKLKQTYSTFEFLHGDGLLVVAAGKQQSAKIQSMMNLGGNRSGARIMQDVYSRLGIACRESWFSNNGKKQIKALEQQLSETSDRLVAHEQQKAEVVEQYQQACHQREAVQQQNQELQSNVDLRFDELAKLTILLNQTETELHSANAENTKLQQAVSSHQQLAAEKQQLERNIQSLQTTTSQKETALHAATAELNTVRQQVATQQSQITQLQQQSQQLEKSLSAANEARQAEVGKLAEQLANEQGKCRKQTIELTDANGKLTEQDKRIRRLEQNNQLLEADQKQAALTIEELKQENRRLEQSLHERFDELAVLTRMLEEKEQQIQQKNTNSTANTTVDKPVGKKRPSLNFKLLGKRQAAKAKLQEKITQIEQSGLFDTQWYVNAYPAAAKYKGGAIAHYLMVGASEGHNPSPDFNSGWYLDAYLDVKEAGVNPLLHYIQFGRNEGRFAEKA